MLLLQPNHTRSIAYRAVFAATTLLAVGVSACKRDESPLGTSARKPNILLVTFDTTRADRIGCYGYKPGRTPTIDALAARGLRYSRCYAPAPITLPSHASLLTGLYPFRHGLRDNGTGPLDSVAETLAEVLREAGYRTGAAIGAQVLNSRYGLNQGFDVYDENIGASRLTDLHIAERPAVGVTDAALAWLGALEPSPYFLWVHYFDPHEPYAPPGGSKNLGRFEAYDGEISYADQQLGRLLEHVRARDAANDTETVIIVTADHGESLDEHGERTHGLFIYDTTQHVPLIVTLPGQQRTAATIDTPVSLVDVYPSLLDWLNVELPYEVDGRTLPVRSGAASAATEAVRGIYLETQLPWNSYGWSPLYGLVVGPHKYIDAPTPELYDLAADPAESSNIYGQRGPDALQIGNALESLLLSHLDGPSFGDGAYDANIEAVKQLRALGYVGTAVTGHVDLPSAGGNALPDPKDLASVHNDAIMAALRLERGDFTESAALLDKVFAADPDNRWALSLLIEMLKQPDGFLAGVETARGRMAVPLPPDFDVQLPAAIGFGAVRAGQGAVCLDMLSDLVKKKPASGELRCALAAVLMQLGRTDEARQQFEATLERDPDDIMALTGLGDLAVMKSDHTAAVSRFEAAVTTGDATADVYAKLGLALESAGRSNDAIAAYRESIKLDPALIEARLTLADLLTNMGRTSEAVSEYLSVIELSPETAEAHYNLGLAYVRQSQTSLAAEAFARAVELKPIMGDALINLAISLMQQKELDQAEAMLNRARQIDAVAAESCYMLGVVSAQRGNIGRTIELYEEAIRIKPAYFAPVDELSRYYVVSDREDDAARVLEVGIKHMPDRVELLERLARIRATSRDDSLRKGQEALALATRARDLMKTRRADVLATLAAAQAETGDFANAIATCELAKQIESRNPRPDASRLTLIDKQLARFRAGKPYRAGD